MIKYRAWVTDELGSGYDSGTVVEPSGQVYELSYCELGEEVTDTTIIEQSTGLKDKNGREIYEGDIISWNSNVHVKRHWIGIVKYRGAGFTVDSGGTFQTSAWLETKASRIKVIGNVHENPDLLGERQ